MINLLMVVLIVKFSIFCNRLCLVSIFNYLSFSLPIFHSVVKTLKLPLDTVITEIISNSYYT